MSDDQQRRWRDAAGYRGDLLRFAHRFAGSREDAEDAVSEAILRAGLTENIDETRMWSWLVAVTKRLCVDQHRRRPRPEHLSRIYAREALDERPVDEAVCGREEAAWVARHVDLLPDRQRAVLYLRADDVPIPEIAAKLDTSYKTVESLTSRARTSIRAAMAATLVALFGLVRRASRLAKPAVVAAAPVAFAVAALVILDTAPSPPRPDAGPPSGLFQLRPERPARASAEDPSGARTVRTPARLDVDRALESRQRPASSPPRYAPDVVVDGPGDADLAVLFEYIDTGREFHEEVQYCASNFEVRPNENIGCAR